MCECLEFDDGSIHLCEVCAGMWREVEEEKEKQRTCSHKYVAIRNTELLFCTICGKIDDPHAGDPILI